MTNCSLMSCSIVLLNIMTGYTNEVTSVGGAAFGGSDNQVAGPKAVNVGGT
jgi:hypothetical protein